LASMVMLVVPSFGMPGIAGPPSRFEVDLMV
jgi:hypothetical protein